MSPLRGWVICNDAIPRPRGRGYDMPPLRGLKRKLGSRASLHRQRVQFVPVVQKQSPVGGDRGCVNGAAHVHLGQDLLFLAVLQDDDIAVLVTEVDLAISEEWR